MPSIKVYNMAGEEVGTMELSEELFGAKINENLVHQAVLQYLANNRQGTQKAKTRSEVSGGGKKAGSPGSRRERDMPVRVPSDLPSGGMAAWYLRPRPGTIPSR